jgi:carboxyl-terminal processing protease
VKFIFTLALILFTFVPLKAQTAAVVVPDAVSAEEADLRKQSFDKVWNTINDRHYDRTFGGVDWARMREIYAPKAASAKTRAEFHVVLRQMLAELKLSHFGIYPRDAETVAAQKTNGAVGIELKMLDGLPVINHVDPGSAAAEAGLKPGFVVQKIDGALPAEILKPLEDSFANRKLTAGMQKVFRERVLLGTINGKAGTTLKLDVLDEKDQPRAFEVARKSFAGEMSQPLGNFPAQQVVFESKLLPDGVGYIRFSMWVIPQIQKFRQALKELAHAKGLIIDLRGNPGGIGGMAPGFAGMLVKEKTSLGTMNFRDSEQKFVVYPQNDPFLGKVVILEDYGSASTSEVFASGMQEIGRAKIVGETSAGAVLPSVFDTLPTGVIFQYAVSDYRSPKNVLIEGRGVLPDVEVRQTREALLNGRDLPLRAAEKMILDEK